MKYTAIVTYPSGEKTGVVIKADSLYEAWHKLDDLIPLKNLRSVEFANILTQEREG